MNITLEGRSCDLCRECVNLLSLTTPKVSTILREGHSAERQIIVTFGKVKNNKRIILVNISLFLEVQYFHRYCSAGFSIGKGMVVVFKVVTTSRRNRMKLVVWK